MNENSFSIIVPALNEEGEIASAISCLTEVYQGFGLDYEILVFNDGSSDRTGEIAEKLSEEDPHIKVIHHHLNQGVGVSTKEAVQIAQKKYIAWFSGDNSDTKESLQELIFIAKEMKEDVLIAYVGNSRERRFFRRILSFLYTLILNVLFGMNLKYYNGPSVVSLKAIRGIDFKATGHDCFAEILIKIIKAGGTYQQQPITMRAKKGKKSKALSCKNLINIAGTLLRLLKSVYFNRRR